MYENLILPSLKYYVIILSLIGDKKGMGFYYIALSLRLHIIIYIKRTTANIINDLVYSFDLF